MLLVLRISPQRQADTDPECNSSIEDREDGRRILCDGGRPASMESHVLEALGELRQAKKSLDYIYVSHVDNDHITGVLTLLNCELQWRVHEYRKKHGIKTKSPSLPRPPPIGGIWHNGFGDQLDENQAAIESLLAASVPTLNAVGLSQMQQAASELEQISTAVKEGIKVFKLVAPELLNIPLNKLPGKRGRAKLLMVRKGQRAFRVGSLAITIVGPMSEELDAVRQGWNTWLRNNTDAVAAIRAEMKRKLESLGQQVATHSDLLSLGGWNGIPDYKGVTAPNVASLMLMVEEGGHRVLLTGDAQQEFILRGLEKAKFLVDGVIHLDVLKVQHHGSENNLDAEFCRQLSADHYVFCGNGAHGNPEEQVINDIFESRLGAASKCSRAPEAHEAPFHFWFSTHSSKLEVGSKERTAFAAREKLVEKLRARAKGRLKVHFNKSTALTLTL
jgi:beta-lactamase superfamily II metal-dependent hydrolase